MFGPHRDRISLGATPERAYYCILYLKSLKQPIKKKAFYEAMCIPEVFEDNHDYFNKTYNVLQQLGLIQEVDNMVRPTSQLLSLESPSDFRRYASRTAFQWEDSLFFRVTSCYCAFAEEFLKAVKKEDVRVILDNHGVKTSNYDDVLSWRLWAPYLGCGYLNGDYMIPNWQQRIADLLFDQKEFKKKEDIPIARFVEWLKAFAPETAASFNGTQIGLGVSNGLNTLNDLGILEIFSLPDAAQWQLVKTSGDPKISHVRIRG